jgi:hypothetical protein
MSPQSETEPLFPKFEKFVIENDLLSKAKGGLSAKLPRVMGQGKTKAEGLNLPPAAIERKIELISFPRFAEMEIPKEVLQEIDRVRQEVDSELMILKTVEGRTNLVREVLRLLPGNVGQKDGHFFAGRLVLVPVNRGQTWAWSVTPYYPIISKIPPDIIYLEKAYAAAEELLERVILPIDLFENRLHLAWLLARHFSNSNDVLIIDVARMFKISCQEERFWNTPQKRFFNDVPEAAFIANILNWRRHQDHLKDDFEFVRATLHQAHGPRAKVYYLPQNPEGTQVTPVIYLRKTN